MQRQGLGCRGGSQGSCTPLPTRGLHGAGGAVVVVVVGDVVVVVVGNLCIVGDGEQRHMKTIPDSSTYT